MAEVQCARAIGLSFSSFTFATGTNHPYVRTLVEYARGTHTQYAGSYLEHYYGRARPANLAEALGLKDVDANPDLIKAPVVSNIYPWSAGSLTETVGRKQKWWSERDASLGGGNAFTFNCGPASAAAGEQRFRALTALYDSIKHRGYSPSEFSNKSLFDSHIIGHLFYRGEDWRVFIGGGNHRSAALCAHGWSKLPILVMSTNRVGPLIIRREDAGSWPLVKAGLFSIQQAQGIFDRMFEGRQPQAYHQSFL